MTALAPEIRDLAEDMVAAGCRTFYPGQLARDASVHPQDAMVELERLVDHGLLVRREDPELGAVYQPTEAFIGRALRHGRLVMMRDLLVLRLLAGGSFLLTVTALILAALAFSKASTQLAPVIVRGGNPAALSGKLGSLTHDVSGLQGSAQSASAQLTSLQSQLGSLKAGVGGAQSSADAANTAIRSLTSRVNSLDSKLAALQAQAPGTQSTPPTTTTATTGSGR